MSTAKWIDLLFNFSSAIHYHNEGRHFSGFFLDWMLMCSSGADESVALIHFNWTGEFEWMNALQFIVNPLLIYFAGHFCLSLRPISIQFPFHRGGRITKSHLVVYIHSSKYYCYHYYYYDDYCFVFLLLWKHWIVWRPSGQSRGALFLSQPNKTTRKEENYVPVSLFEIDRNKINWVLSAQKNSFKHHSLSHQTTSGRNFQVLKHLYGVAETHSLLLPLPRPLLSPPLFGLHCASFEVIADLKFTRIVCSDRSNRSWSIWMTWSLGIASGEKRGSISFPDTAVPSESDLMFW